MDENMSRDMLPPFRNFYLPVGERVGDLISRLTLVEKVSQMLHESPAIPRLDIPAYNWWNECLHGVARAGVATVFPQAIGMAASFDPGLLYRVARAISEEARAKHHEAARREERGSYHGLTFWSPNVNIFRDPRWGRGQETYGEDPWLTGRMGVSFIRGLQGNDPKYLQAVATPKHYAVHSGPEKDRHHIDVRVSRKDLRETYLPAFHDCVVEGGAASVMGAYNRVNGEPCCGSRTLLQEILRDEWGFDGYVVSDCGAVEDFHLHHQRTASPEESAALAVAGGCDLNCGRTYSWLLTAVQAGLIGEEAIDRALARLLTARFRLGMFDPPEMVPYASIPYEVNDCRAHRGLALLAARESLVLLKNEGQLLPLGEKVDSIAVIGPLADDMDVLLGNYSGIPSESVSLLEGIRRRAGSGTAIIPAKGCDDGGERGGLSEAVDAAARAEVVIMVLGLSSAMEGEEGDAPGSESGGDRVHLGLPGVQQELLEAVHAVGKPIVLVLTGGSPLAVNWAEENVPAILMTWYPGEEGGTAVADALFGDYTPAGRLPVTFVKSTGDLPPFDDYDMTGRTYRFGDKEPLFPFGYGLSYTSFRYRDLVLSASEIGPTDNLQVRVMVENTGRAAGEEVVQVYLSDLEASTRAPRWQLCATARPYLRPGESKRVALTVTPRQMSLIDDEGRRVLEPGAFRIWVGGRQPDERSRKLSGTEVLSAEFSVVGEKTILPY